MKKYLLENLFMVVLVLFFATTVQAQNITALDKARWAVHANQVNIIRDEWEIPHIYGKTDADAVLVWFIENGEKNLKQFKLIF